ncbi:MAG: AraC family transcriptional regulator [Polyangiaceae bacterium]
MTPRKTSSKEPASLVVAAFGAHETWTHRTTEPSIVLTLEAHAAAVTSVSRTHALDRTGILVLPRGAVLRARTASPSCRIAAVGWSDARLDETVRGHATLGMDRPRFDAWLRRACLLPRTVWVQGLVHRYVFERHALGATSNLATHFLEIEMAKELWFLFRDRDEGVERARSGQKYSPQVERAVAFIEANLFRPVPLAELARRAFTSESTLLRSFRRELGTGPGDFWRTRRLDEAMVLLRTGRVAVAEVAARVGYDNPTSFGHAFAVRFGAPPSRFVPRRPTRPAP